jgi:hypothetical protein
MCLATRPLRFRLIDEQGIDLGRPFVANEPDWLTGQHVERVSGDSFEVVRFVGAPVGDAADGHLLFERTESAAGSSHR